MSEKVDMAALLEGATPRQLLVKWANAQDSWIRHIVADVLAAKQPLSSDEVEAVYSEFLIEKGLAPGTYVDLAPLVDVDDSAQAEDQLELLSLSGVVGVNALAGNQTIEFDPCVTIMFGENGSGKTGYARILKRLAAVRTAEQILPDINGVGTLPEPSADIAFKLGNTQQSLRWQNETGLAPFTRVSVFDAPCVSIHVDSELNYVYTPVELALFAYIGEAVRGVQTLAEQEAATLKVSATPFLARFTRGSRIYPLIEMLGPTSDMNEINQLGVLSDDERARRITLETEIAALRGSGLAAMQAAASELVIRLQRANDVVKLAATFNGTAYETARVALERAQQERRRARGELFNGGELAGPADDEWQSFVSEGEHYRQHLGLADYPGEGDRCLYCRQELSPTAIAIIGRYRSFLEDALANQVSEADRAARHLALPAGSVSLQVMQADCAALLAMDPVPPYAAELSAVVDVVIETVQLTAALALAPSSALSTRALALLESIEPALEASQAQVASLSDQIDNVAEALKSRQAEFIELDARLTLEQILPNVRNFVLSAKRGLQLSTLAKGLSATVLRRLTELSKLASEDLVNQDFERLFREECEALRAPRVALEFQGRRGKAERKKAVAQYKPSSILSEGEQKVLALADFLAEGRMGSANAPIVFDDPVTSLDYRRMAEVAGRISLLGETHQVIVFTHNIMFASALLGLRVPKKLRCKFYEIRDEELLKGIVQPAGEPRSDTCADFESKINVLLQTMKSADAVVRDALLGSAYGLLRSWCEAFVEQEVLQNVSQRYRVNIMMSNLAKIKADRLADVCSRLIPIFDHCSRFMPGHSQPLEQLNVQPKLTEFEADFSAAKQLRAAYLAK